MDEIKQIGLSGMNNINEKCDGHENMKLNPRQKETVEKFWYPKYLSIGNLIPEYRTGVKEKKTVKVTIRGRKWQ